MNRREFIALCAAMSPFVLADGPAIAQQKARVPLIGVAAGFTEQAMRPLLEAFSKQLQVHGWTVGSNVLMQARYASGAYEAEQARALIAMEPDIIVTQGTGMLTVVRRETKTIPIVFTMVPDPVSLGIVSNLAHPGENVTGFTNFEFSIGGKWLELLKEIQPSIRHVRLIANPGNPNNLQFSKHIEGQGPSFGVEVTTSQVRTVDEIVAAIDDAAKTANVALLMLPDSLLVVNSARFAEAAAKHSIPALGPFKIFTDSGGLMSYGLNFSELYR
jgi:putative ABC transport system substrate-binding protein